jgi:hypothetical protein
MAKLIYQLEIELIRWLHDLQAKDSEAMTKRDYISQAPIWKRQPEGPTWVWVWSTKQGSSQKGVEHPRHMNPFKGTRQLIRGGTMQKCE